MKNLKKLIIVIMAGGKGERLWPKSRPTTPKQFCKITTDQTMIKDTYDRFSAFVPKENIYISISDQHKKLLQTCIPKFPSKNMILEPSARDTSCAILLSILSIKSKPDQIFLFTPADHFINDVASFQKDIISALKVTNQSSQMTLIGIQPTSPSESYGYIKVKPSKSKHFLVDQFVEKPTEATAKKYLKTKKYFWNSGLFMFKAEHLLQLYQQYMKTDFKQIQSYLQQKKKFPKKAIKAFEQVTKISFDYAIVEKLKDIQCVPAHFDWDDVGNWEALYRIKKADNNGNILNGKNINTFKCQDVICESDIKKIIVLNGIKDIIVINTEDVLYVTHRSTVGDIKEILKKINN